MCWEAEIPMLHENGFFAYVLLSVDDGMAEASNQEQDNRIEIVQSRGMGQGPRLKGLDLEIDLEIPRSSLENCQMRENGKKWKQEIGTL